MTKMTKKDFALYKEECQKWIELLGLKNWEVRFKLEDDDDTEIASINFNTVQRWVDFIFQKEWPIDITRKEIEKAAYHEAMELLFADIRELAISRSFDAEQFNKEIHKVIYVFQGIFFD